jgi:hypothetical protein
MTLDPKVNAAIEVSDALTGTAWSDKQLSGFPSGYTIIRKSDYDIIRAALVAKGEGAVAWRVVDCDGECCGGPYNERNEAVAAYNYLRAKGAGDPYRLEALAVTHPAPVAAGGSVDTAKAVPPARDAEGVQRYYQSEFGPTADQNGPWVTYAAYERLAAERDTAMRVATDYNSALKRLVMRAHDMNAGRSVYDLHDVTEGETPMGSWRITVEELAAAETAERERDEARALLKEVRANIMSAVLRVRAGGDDLEAEVNRIAAALARTEGEK